MWQKKKLLVLSNFFFCHYVFKQEHRLRMPDARLILSFYGLFILYKKYLNSERIFTYYNDRTQLLFFKYWNRINYVEINTSSYIHDKEDLHVWCLSQSVKIMSWILCMQWTGKLYWYIKSTLTKDIEYITIFLFLVTLI